jgi:hypothetical protein
MYELPKVFVVPAEGVKIPLPIDGMRIPGVGMTVTRTMHIERLLRNGDLVEGDAAEALAAPRKVKADAEAKAAQDARDAEAAKYKPPATEEVKAPAGGAANKTQPDAAGSKG